MQIHGVLLKAVLLNVLLLPGDAFLSPSRHRQWQLPSRTTNRLQTSRDSSSETVSIEKQPSRENSIDYLRRVSVKPPSQLQALFVGETLSLQGTPVTITRVAQNPDIFVMRNFLPPEDCQRLITEALKTGMETAETKTGQTAHRSKSSVGWIPHGVLDVADFMTSFCMNMFVNEEILESTGMVEPENLQIANYEVGGRFDVHHDGWDRSVTVLTYLNGVAGTWFPFAVTNKHPRKDFDDEKPPKIVFDGSMTEGKSPGVDGLFVGDKSLIEQSADLEVGPKVVSLSTGDSIVFYNYEYNDEMKSSIMAWRSLHAGMLAPKEKWIATNWIESTVPPIGEEQ